MEDVDDNEMEALRRIPEESIQERFKVWQRRLGKSNGQWILFL